MSISQVTQTKRWRLAATASALVVALNVAGCSKLPGAASSDPSATDGTTTTAVLAQAAPTAAASPTPRAGANNTASARRGPIVQTLSLIGKVSAAEETPLAFGEKLSVQSVDVKPGQTVDAGQSLVTADGTEIQTQLDAANTRLAQDTNSLTQAQATIAANQRAAAQAAASAQQARADRIAAAQSNLNSARANLQKLQAGPAPADVQAAQNAVTAAQIAERKAETDQTKAVSGPDATAVKAAEQELANAEAAVARAQSDLDKMTGSQPAASAPAAQGPVMAANITPSGVSMDSANNNFGFQAIAADPSRPSTIYLGTCNQGLWKTTDGGKSWAKINTGTNGSALDSGRVWAIAIDPADPKVLYVAPGYGVGGVWKSTDGGVNWTALIPDKSPVAQQLGGVPTPSNIVIDPSNHLHLIASSHFWWGGQYKDAGGVGVLETNDAGKTWVAHAPIPGSGAEQEVGMVDSSTWLVASQAAGMFRTTDSGGTWTKVADANAQLQSLLNINGTLYVPAASGVLRSTDRGATWQNVGPGGLALGTDGVNIYTQESAPGTYHEAPLYFSAINDGNTWTQYSSQTTCIGKTCDGAGWMSFDTANHVVYMSNWLAGVWKLQTIGGDAQPAAAPTPATNNNTNPDVLAARQRLQTAKDNADAARAKLASLRQADTNGVDASQLSIDQAQLAVQQAQAHLDQLRAGPNPADLKAAQDAVSLAQTALDRANASGSAVDTQAPDNSEQDLSTKQAAIDKDNADIAKLQARLAATQLVAPFAGTVVTVRVKSGDTTDPKTPAVTMARPGVPVIKSTITPADADQVSVGQSVQVSYQGQPDPSTPVMGKVTSLTPNDAGTTKVAVIELDWPDTAPKFGTVANLGVVLQSKDDALIVPKKAVHTVNAKTFVELVDGRTKKITTVQLGIVGSNEDEIVSGLSEGQIVTVAP